MLFRNASSPASSRRSSGSAGIFSRNGSSAGGRSVGRRSSGASRSSCSSGVRAALKAALSDTELQNVADRIHKGASQKYGSLQKALKGVRTDDRGGMSRAQVRSFCDEYGMSRRDSDRLFERLDEAREGSINVDDFKDCISATAPNHVADSISKQTPSPSATPPNASPRKLNVALRAEVEAESVADKALVETNTEESLVEKRTDPSFVKGSRSLKQLRAKDLDKLFNEMSHRMAPKHGTSSKASRDMDFRGARRVNKEDLIKALRANGYDDSVASQLFDYIDKDANGDVDFKEFKALFSHAMFDLEDRRGKRRPREVLGEKSVEKVEPPQAVFDVDPVIEAQTAKPLSEPELEQILKDVCSSIAQKHESVRKAYTDMVLRGKGKFDRHCLRANMDLHGYDASTADQLFSWLDKDGSGCFDYGEFRDAFAPYLMPDWVHAKKKEKDLAVVQDTSAAFDVVPKPKPKKLLQKELKLIFQDVAAAIARHNHCSVKKAWESLNRERHGEIHCEQLAEYMRNLNYDDSIAEQLFTYLDDDNSGKLSYQEFRNWFGPYIMPDWVEDRTKRPDRALPSFTREPKDREVRRVVKEIGNALSQKYKSAYEAFEQLDFNGNGALSQEEVREFFGRWNYGNDLADRFFTEFDVNGDGDISYLEFQAHFTPYIVQGYDGKGFGSRTTNHELAAIRSRKYPVKVKDPELALAIEAVGEACRRRFGDIRRAWHMVHNEKDGTASRNDICKFLSHWGYSKQVGDKFFDHMASNGDDRIDYRTFHNEFAPYVYGWPQLGEERGALEAPKSGLDDGCASVLSVRSSRSQRQMSESVISSARSSIAQSQKSNRPQSARSGPSSSALKSRKLKEKEVAQIFHDLAVATARHNHSVNKAWGALNPARVGAITKEKMQEHMALYGYDEATASQVFDYVDKDGSGEIDYQEFQSLFGPYIMPDWVEKREISKKDRGWPDAAPELKDKEMKKVVRELGEAFGKRYKTAFQAFRQMDSNSSGSLTREEVREFFGKFNFGKTLADRFFDCLDQNDDGDIDYREFQSHFSPYIVKGYDGKAWGQRAAPEISVNERLLAPKKIEDKELARVVESVGQAASKRYRTIRDAWRAVDRDKDGKICRKDVKEWFSHYGYEEDVANKFFDYVNHEGDEIDYREFNNHFGPHIFGWRQLGLETLDKYRSRSAPELATARSVVSRDGTSSIASSVSRTTQYSEKDLNRIASHIGEKMRDKHGNNVRRAFRSVAHDNKDHVTRDDMKHLFRNYGYPDVADQFFDKIDTEQTGGVKFLDLQRHFADKPYAHSEGQTSYRSAYGS